MHLLSCSHWTDLAVTNTSGPQKSALLTTVRLDGSRSWLAAFLARLSALAGRCS